MVFHRRRSSHLFYTPYVFSQCQTRVKLNQIIHRPPPGICSRDPRPLRRLPVGALCGGTLSRGISMYLKPAFADRHLAMRYVRPQAGCTRDWRDAFPEPGCLAPQRPTRTVAGLVILRNTFDPVVLVQGLLSPLILPSPFPWLWFR